MANDKKMDLLMRIRADANQALAELGRVTKAIGGVATGTGQLAAKSFHALGDAAGYVFAPLKAIAGIGAVAATALLGAAGASLHAAGTYEQLRMRLEAVTGSAEKAREAFAETSAFAAATPFEIADLVDARILLEGIGVTGPKALKSTANAAAAMGRSTAELAQVVASMESEPLRRLGISAKREGDKIEIEFRDRNQRLQRVTATGATEMRMALLGVFDTKFSGAVDKLGNSFFGKASTVKDNLTQAAAAFGAGLIPAANAFMDRVNARLGELAAGGQLDKIGKRVGEAIMGAIDWVVAAVKVFGEIRNELKDQPTAIGDILRQAIGSGGTLAGQLLFEYLKAGTQIFVGIGKVLAGAFMEDILKLPFLQGTRLKMASSGMAGLSKSEQMALMGSNMDAPGENTPAWGHKLYDNEYVAMLNKLFSGQLGPDVEARIAAGGRGRYIKEGADQALAALPNALASVQAAAAAEYAKLVGTLNQATGGNVGDRIEAQRKIDSEQAYADTLRLYTFKRARTVTDSTGVHNVDETYKRLGPAAGPNVGDQRAGGIVINVERMVIDAQHRVQVMRDVVRQAIAPKAAAAGAL